MAYYYVTGRTFSNFYDMKFGRSGYEPFAYIVRACSYDAAATEARLRMGRERGHLSKVDVCLEVPVVQSNLDTNHEDMNWWDANLKAFDVETTGFDYEEERITEIGISTYSKEDKTFGSPRSYLINEGIKLPDGGVRRSDGTPVNDITNELLADKPTFKEVYEEGLLNDILEEGVILVAQNRGFDAGHLYHSLRRSGHKGYFPPFICSMEVAMQIDVGQPVSPYGNVLNNLEVLKNIFNIGDEKQSHRAGDDAQDAGNVFLQLVRRHPEFRSLRVRSVRELLQFFDRT